MTSTAPSDPNTFYRERIPEQFNAGLRDRRRAADSGDATASATHAAMAAVNSSMCVIVHGADEDPQETFWLNVDKGEMHAGEAARHPLLVTLVHDRASFEALARASGDSILGFLGGLVGLGDEMRLTAQRVENLALLDGTFRFELTGDGGFVLTAHFGAGPIADEPNASLVMEAEVYRQLRDGELQAQDAFFSGAIQCDGDMQLAIQLALAALAPDV